MSQYFWKKIGLKPSRPGAFTGLKEKISLLISQSMTLSEVASRTWGGGWDESSLIREEIERLVISYYLLFFLKFIYFLLSR